MQRRLLVIALVFVVGFGVGYGITWLLVGSSDRERPDGEREARVAQRATGGEEDARDQAPRPEPDTHAGDARTEGAPGPDAAASVDAATAPEDAALATGETAADTAPAGATDAAAPPARPPWERCLNRVCRVDFGRVSGGISIRKGRLEHGQAVDWDRDFGRADKVGTLEEGADVRVEVLGVGLADGVPAAAYIVRKTRRDEVRGVIALRIGDKTLELVPVE